MEASAAAAAAAAPTTADLLRAGLNVMRRLPPADVATNVTGLCILQPDSTEDFLQRIDQPLQTRVCKQTKRRYIICDFSRDGDCYRNPFTNTYDPPLDDGVTPSQPLRLLEVASNELLDAYRELYYGEGGASCSSAYFWDSGGAGFASAWLIHKDMAAGRSVNRGLWDAIHVFDVTPSGPTQCVYKLTTTVMLSIGVDKPAGHGALDLNGSLTRQASSTLPVSAEKGHAQNMGAMVEAMEGDLRASLDALYIAKTREMVSALRPRGAGAAVGKVGMVGMMGGGGGGGGPAAAGAFVSDLSAALHKRSGGTV
jgi:capping protein beta